MPDVEHQRALDQAQTRLAKMYQIVWAGKVIDNPERTLDTLFRIMKEWGESGDYVGTAPGQVREMANSSSIDDVLGDVEQEWAARRRVEGNHHVFHVRPSVEHADALIAAVELWKADHAETRE